MLNEMVNMKNNEANARSIIGPAVDKFMAAVPWTKNRMVIIYHRLHAGREYVRLRTFNRHRIKGCWYPAPRFYMVPIEHAEQLGNAIIAASHGRSRDPAPEWYADFEKQYNSRAWQKQPNGTPPE